MKIWGFTTAIPIEGQMAGGTVFYHQVAKKFVEAGHEVEIKVFKKNNRIVQNLDLDGVKYRLTSDPRGANLILLHSASLKANPLLSQFDQPIIYILHSSSPLIEDQLAALKKKDYLISNSENMMKTVSHLNTNHEYIYPICDEMYNTDYKKGKFITTIGSSVVKNIGLFYELTKRFPLEHFLHVKGGYGNTHYNKPMNMTFVNNTTDLRSIYEKTRILVVPSFTETYSLVAREAGLQGIPVVCSNLPGLRENLGNSGLYANPDKVQSFVEQIKKLNDVKYYEKVSQNIQTHCRIQEAENIKKLNLLIKSL